MFDVNAIIDRLLLLAGAKNDTEYCLKRDLARSTIGNWRKRQSVPYSECEFMFFEHNASMDWILTGEGSMFRSNQFSNVAPQEKNSQLAQWVNHYAETRTRREFEWLEMEIARQFPEYNAWRLEQGHEPLASADWFDRFLISPLFRALSPEQRKEIAAWADAAAKDSQKKP